ncbi:MAG: response regulator [Anaerolineaceae bacterium]
MAEKILIVDDDPETLRLVSMILQRQSYGIATAVNGMQGITMARTEQPDLILLDVMMPDLDGYQVCHQIRSNPETAAIPIIMFTAKTQVEDKVAGYDAGVDDYITKPIHPAELAAHIRSLLARRKPQAEVIPAQGRVIGVISAKGGLGVSTIALNLAVSLHIKTNASTFAIEMRPSQGTWSLLLGQPNTEGLIRLLEMPPADITRTTIEREIFKSQTGVGLLFASTSLKNSDVMTAYSQVEALVHHLPSLGTYIILDLGSELNPFVDPAIDICDEIILVTDPFPVTVSRTKHMMGHLLQKGFGKSRILTVVLFSRARSDLQLSVQQVRDLLENPVPIVIPPAPEQAFQAASRSVPLILAQPDSLVSQQINSLTDFVLKHT